MANFSGEKPSANEPVTIRQATHTQTSQAKLPPTVSPINVIIQRGSNN